MEAHGEWKRSDGAVWQWLSVVAPHAPTATASSVRKKISIPVSYTKKTKNKSVVQYNVSHKTTTSLQATSHKNCSLVFCRLVLNILDTF